jgi:carbon storage regulator
VPNERRSAALPTTERLTRATRRCKSTLRRPGTGNTLGELRAMLVLSRKKNETIIIDDHIVITVVEIRGDKVRLGIEAPKEIPIHRSEVRAQHGRTGSAEGHKRRQLARFHAKNVSFRPRDAAAARSFSFARSLSGRKSNPSSKSSGRAVGSELRIADLGPFLAG